MFKTVLLSMAILVSLPAVLRAEVDEFSLQLPRILRRSAGVFQVKGVSFGSGFLYGTDKWIYVVTAKHNLVDPSSGRFKFDVIRYLWHPSGPNDPTPSAVEIRLSDDLIGKTILLSDRDVAAIRIGKFGAKGFETPANVKSINLGVTREEAAGRIMIPLNETLLLRFADVEETLDVLVYGYPADLEKILPPAAIQFDPGWPVYRRGMIAQINRRNKTIIIDGMVHGGNSGSPVFQIVSTPTTKKYSLIGVVTQRMFDMALSTTGTINGLQNAGYAVVEPMDSVVELIKRND